MPTPALSERRSRCFARRPLARRIGPHRFKRVLAVRHQPRDLRGFVVSVATGKSDAQRQLQQPQRERRCRHGARVSISSSTMLPALRFASPVPSLLAPSWSPLWVPHLTVIIF